MADPSIQTFCCHRVKDTSESVDFLSELNSETYNTVCLASSTIGIFGALYQILPREHAVSPHRWVALTSSRGRHIVIWLAVADLFASLGVFLRSVLWLNLNKWPYRMDDSTTTLLCALSAAWIQYFYTATWLWTMVYAIDMWLVLKERDGYPFQYHFAVWTIPAVLTSAGLAILYIPNANCHSVNTLPSVLLRILPNYFATYVPMAAVLVVNPAIYLSLTNQVEAVVARSLAQFTNKERHLVDVIRIKFLLINIAFYVCWLPNLINGIIIWALWFELPQKIIIALWYVMALMNPLQALFNSIVYRKWSGGAERVYIPCRRSSSESLTKSGKQSSTESAAKLPYANESTPLMGSSINCSSNSDDEEDDHHFSL